MTESVSYKLVLIGDQGVGKSNLLTRFTQDRFDPASRSTIGVDFGTKFVQLGDNVVKLQVWDTAGQENYRALAPTYYRGARGVIVVYDITRRETFEHVEYWMSEIRNNSDPDIGIMLIGNKSDEQARRAVSTEEAKLYADKHQLYFMEASAMDSSNTSTIILLQWRKIVALIWTVHHQRKVLREADVVRALKVKQEACDSSWHYPDWRTHLCPCVCVQASICYTVLLSTLTCQNNMLLISEIKTDVQPYCRMYSYVVR